LSPPGLAASLAVREGGYHEHRSRGSGWRGGGYVGVEVDAGVNLVGTGHAGGEEMTQRILEATNRFAHSSPPA